MTEILFWTYAAGWVVTGLTPAVMASRGRWSSDDHWQFVVLGALWPLLLALIPIALAEEWQNHRRKETRDG